MTQKLEFKVLGERLRLFGFRSYPEYLRSQRWHINRTALMPTRCKVCRGTRGLEAHHTTYVRLGQERKGDLIALCRDCHQLTHNFCAYRPDANLGGAHVKLKALRERVGEEVWQARVRKQREQVILLGRKAAARCWREANQRELGVRIGTESRRVQT